MDGHADNQSVGPVWSTAYQKSRSRSVQVQRNRELVNCLWDLDLDTTNDRPTVIPSDRGCQVPVRVGGDGCAWAARKVVYGYRVPAILISDQRRGEGRAKQWRARQTDEPCSQTRPVMLST